jgi:putative ABC transport system permease protein
VAIAVAGMFAMQLVALQLSEHAASNSRQWIAADVALDIDRPLSAGETERALHVVPHVRMTLVTELPALASSDQAPDPAPVQVKAVDPNVYPLYGSLDLKSGRPLKSCLDAQSAVISQSLLDALQERPDGIIRIREANFRIAGVIGTEPDRFAGPYSSAHRVILSDAGLDRTGLLRFSSAAFYRVLFQIPLSQNTAAICRRLEQLFPDGRVRDYTTPMPMISVTADWIVPFLRVAGILSLGFGTGAIAALSRVYLLQRWDIVAILKSLGATSRLLIDVFLFRTLGLSLLGSTVGLLAGWMIQRLEGRIVLQTMGIHLNSHVPAAVLTQCLLLGVYAASAAAGASIWAIRRVRPAIFTRRDAGEKDLLIQELGTRVHSGLGVLAGLALPAILLLWAGDAWRARTLIVAASTGAALAILLSVRAAVALCSRAARRLSSDFSFPIRHGLANAQRYGRQTRSALLVLTGAVAIVLIAGLGRRQIAELVIDSLPIGAHNLLLFNVDSSDAAKLSGILKTQAGILSPPALVPSTLLTLASVDGNSLDTIRAKSPNWIHKMWPATCSATPPHTVRILNGNWWTSGSPTSVAIEENAAALLGVHVGSRIAFLADGTRIPATVAAIVRVPPLERFWYRLTLSCQAFQSLPINLYSVGISVESSRLPQLQHILQEQLHRAAVVDVRDMKQQAERVGSETIQILAIGATLLACVASALLFGAMLTVRPIRVYEMAILRALGASNKILRLSLAAEYAVMGTIAGLIGAPLGLLGANFVLWYITGRLMWIFDVSIVVVTIAACALLVALVGVQGSRSLLATPPLQVLRRR